MIFRLNFLLWLSLAAIFPLSAQFSVQMKIVDVDRDPLSFAYVGIAGLDSTNVWRSVAADLDGLCYFEVLKTGNYQIKVQFLGYADFLDTVRITESLDLGDIILKKASNELAEVTVRGNRALVEQREDRLWYNIASSPLKNGFDGVEVLQRSPNIWVDEEGNILVRNKIARVLVNGRPLRLSGDELAAYLQSINSENIQRIEVQTNSGASQSAANQGGIVNLVLKKPPRGMNGTLRSHYLYRGRASWESDNGLSLNYGAKQWNVYGFYGYRYNARWAENFGTTDYFETDNFLSNVQTALDTFGRHNLRLGTVFDLHPNHLLGAEVFLSTSDFIFDQNDRLDLTNNQELIERGRTLFAGNRDLNTQNATLNYTWKTDTSGGVLRLVGDYTHQEVDWRNRAITSYEIDVYPDNKERNTNENLTEIWGLQADFEKPLSRGVKVTAGFKWTGIDRNNSLLSELLEETGWITNDRSTSFDYRENIGAVYGTLSKQLNEKYFLKAGLRVENTGVDKLDLLDGSEIEQNYANFFPSFFVSRRLSPKNSLSLSYAKGLSRPPFSFLNDNVRKFNDFRYELGNPDLQPEFRHRAELAVKLGDNQFALYLNRVNNAINGIFFLEGEVAFYQKFNEGVQEQWGVEYNRAGKLLPWLFLRATGQVFHRKFIDGQKRELFKQNTLKIRVIGTITLNETTSLELFANYYSPQADAYYIRRPLHEYRLMLQKRLFKKRLNLRLEIRDLFNTLEFSNERPFDTFVTTSRWKPYTRTVRLQLRYTFATRNKVSDRKNRSRNEAGRRL